MPLPKGRTVLGHRQRCPLTGDRVWIDLSMDTLHRLRQREVGSPAGPGGQDFPACSGQTGSDERFADLRSPESLGRACDEHRFEYLQRPGCHGAELVLAVVDHVPVFDFDNSGEEYAVPNAVSWSENVSVRDGPVGPLGRSDRKVRWTTRSYSTVSDEVITSAPGDDWDAGAFGRSVVAADQSPDEPNDVWAETLRRLRRRPRRLRALREEVLPMKSKSTHRASKTLTTAPPPLGRAGVFTPDAISIRPRALEVSGEWVASFAITGYLPRGPSLLAPTAPDLPGPGRRVTAHRARR
jgi:hypothetical protein